MQTPPTPEAEIRRLLTEVFTEESERNYADALARRKQDIVRDPSWAQISGPYKEEPYEDYQLTVTEGPATGLFEVAYHTVWWSQDYSSKRDGLPLFAILGRPELASHLAGLRITVDDENGINGTQTWYLQNLLEAPGRFSALRRFALPLNEVDTHHRRIVGYDDMYEEGNALGLLLTKCPALEQLAAPSAPGPGFFERDSHGLRELVLQCGFEHQGFISNLAASACFPQLARLEFRDFAETYMDDYQTHCVPFEHYRALVSSTTLPALRQLLLLDTVLSEEQRHTLTELAAQHGRELRFGVLE